MSQGEAVTSDGEARPIAFAAFIALTIAVVTGQLLAGRLLAPRYRKRLFSVHRGAAAVGLGLGVAHVAEVAVSRHEDIGVALTPRNAQSGWWIALGLVACAGLAASVHAWAVRREVAWRWQTMHLAAYVAFGAAAVHGWVSHDGAIRRPEVLAYVACVAAVIAAGIARISVHLRRAPRAAA
jgi:DMSO/TMAO reductase YedYZ heme-binding membrane subunit